MVKSYVPMNRGRCGSGISIGLAGRIKKEKPDQKEGGESGFSRGNLRISPLLLFNN